MKTEMRERRGASRSSMQMSLLSRYNDALIDAVLTFYIHFSSSPLSKGGTQSTKLRSNFDERVCEMKRVKRRWTLKSGGNSTMDTPSFSRYTDRITTRATLHDASVSIRVPNLSRTTRLVALPGVEYPGGRC